MSDDISNPRFAWWQHGIVYQVYPRSFQDSNGDGIGDLAGVRARLDHLVTLGVDAVWVSPIYPSPMADFGYDVADYCGIDPIFGTMKDFDALLAEVHGRGLKLILDFVPNHTSDRHPWFIESRSSRDNPKRDWYIWHHAAPDGGPPNNWISNFGGSAWEWDEATGQYYYHAFLAEQPDLNWRNPDVRQAMYDAMRFWLDKGVDGFRVDVIWHLIKDDQFRDNPPNPEWTADKPDIQRNVQLYTTDRPEIHDVVAEMRAVIETYEDRVLIGEIYLPIERLVTYYGTNLEGVHLPFNFQLLQAEWDARHLCEMIADYEEAVPEGGWPNWVLGNHDKSRIASRIGREQARVAGMMLLTLRGTPTMYYADELGLEDVRIPPDRVQDPWEKNEPGLGFNRDPARTPMPWSRAENAGFTTGEPWLPLNEDWRERNVEAYAADPSSILTFYRRLIACRRQRPALNVGSFELITQDGQVLAYIRARGEERIMVALNLADLPQSLPMPEGGQGARVILSTALDRESETIARQLQLRPNEGIILALGEV